MKDALKRWIVRLNVMPLAAWLYETWRLVARPHTHGALVALWDRERLLLVQASYRRCLSLPGGVIHRGETPKEAAVRELAEELAITVAGDAFGQPWGVTELSARGRNTVWIFPLCAEDALLPKADGLEIVDCQWLTRQEALSQSLTAHVRHYISGVE